MCLASTYIYILAYPILTSWYMLPDTCYPTSVTWSLLPNTFWYLFCEPSFLIIVTYYLLVGICYLILVSWHIYLTSDMCSLIFVTWINLYLLPDTFFLTLDTSWHFLLYSQYELWDTFYIMLITFISSKCLDTSYQIKGSLNKNCYLLPVLFSFETSLIYKLTVLQNHKKCFESFKIIQRLTKLIQNILNCSKH